MKGLRLFRDCSDDQIADRRIRLLAQGCGRAVEALDFLAAYGDYFAFSYL